MSEFCDRISRLEVASFDEIIGTAAALIPPDRLPFAKARVSGGIRLLNSESELNDYLVAFVEAEVPQRTMPVPADLPLLQPPDPEDIFMYASAGMVEELESLIKAGVDVDYRNEKGATALYFASKHGNRLCVRLLVKAGANVELEVFGTGMTPYLIAVKYERLDVMQELADSGCDVLARDRKGRGAAEIARVYGLGEDVVKAVESISKGVK